MSDLKSRSYALTIRPHDGITDQQVDLLMPWIRRSSEYYHVVTEKTGYERHIHAGVFLKNKITRSNVVTALMRIYKDLSPTEKSVLRSGIKIMYNNDWVSKYCQKNDDGETVVIASNLPEVSRLESFYPPKPAEKVSAVKRCSLYYHELESLWNVYTPVNTEVNTINCRHFLFNVMYNKRVLPVIRDDKQITQVARHLTRWLNRATVSTIELPVFEKEE